MRRLGLMAGALLLLAPFVTSCGGGGDFSPGSPHESLLSIAAEFEMFAASDPYRDPTPEDLLDQHLADATLVRLANYADLHPGRFAPEVLVLTARASERLGDYETARRSYLEAASYDTEMAEMARQRAQANARRVAILSSGLGNTLEDQVAAYGEIAQSFYELANLEENELDQSLALMEAENAEIARANLLANNYQFFPDGERQAREALSALQNDHRESRRVLEHALAEARFLRRLIENELRLRPAEGLNFDSNRVLALFEDCLDILYRVSQADGRPEKRIAALELDTMLALRDEVIDRAR